MRIRQIALVSNELEATLADLCAVFAVQVAFRDPGVAVFGLANGVMPIGEHFLEVVSPNRQGTSAGRYLERRGGNGGYMVILQTRDLDGVRAHLSRHNVKTVWEIAFDDIATAHLDPRDTGGTLVSIDDAKLWESWRWAGPSWRDHVGVSRVNAIVGVEIQADDPRALAKHWAGIFEIPFADGDTRLRLEDGSWISFVAIDDERGEGIRSIALRTVDATAVRDTARGRGLSVDEDGTVTIAGTRFLVV